jgi:hypothetical protein
MRANRPVAPGAGNTGLATQPSAGAYGDMSASEGGLAHLMYSLRVPSQALRVQQSSVDLKPPQAWAETFAFLRKVMPVNFQCDT